LRYTHHKAGAQPFGTSKHTRGIDADIEQFLVDIDQQLKPHLQRALERVPQVANLKEGVAFQMVGGGKRIRAALCATVCEIFSGSHHPALSFAAAVEHLQNFTLVHDDIADGDDERRGQAAAWKKFGLAHGINIGDIFIPLSALAILEADYQDQTKIRLLQLISNYGLEVAEGQSLDINLRSNNAPTVEDYISCTQKKTGAFFAMAAIGGGIIGGASDSHLEILRRFALQAGVAFQIKDDVLDFAGGKGRAQGSDVKEGKRTLLVSYALEAANRAEKSRLIEILNTSRNKKTEEQVQWVHDLFERAHAQEKAERLAEDLIDSAIDYLLDFPETPAKYRFLRLSKYLTRRVY
jgi:geranylgeranyl pyrophosphate synthase